MNARNKSLAVVALLLGAALFYGGWAAVRAHRDLVTLNVRNMDVREAVKKIEWQTWESIFVHKDVQGKVTLNVRKMPLERVLRLVGDQTSSRSSLIYPLYSGGKSLALLEKALRGEIDPSENGWTNLQSRASFPGGMFGGGPGGFGGPGGMFGGGAFGGGGMFGMPAGNQNPQKVRVSLQLQNKDVSFATLAFSRYAQARIVPEDGTTAAVNLTLNQATVPDAVAQLAKKVRRDWTKLYSLRGGFGMGGPGFNAGPRGPRGPEMTDEQREEMRKQRETLEEELKAVLSDEERRRLEQAEAERLKQMQEMQNMTPEERMQRFSQMTAGQRDKMNQDRVLNSTPEQRAQSRRQGPGGPGGPGGPRR